MIWQFIAVILTLGVLAGLAMVLISRDDKKKVNGYLLSGIFAVLFSILLAIVYSDLFYIIVAFAWVVQVYVTAELIRKMGE